MSEISLSPYEFDRNDAILSLLHEVFKPWDGDAIYFNWKYDSTFLNECPFPRGWIVVKDNRIIAFNGYMPRWIKAGNRDIWVLQSFDTATAPDYRGKRLFGKLQALIYREVEQRKNIPWIYGWASEIGFKVFTTKVGWQVWGNQNYLQRILDPDWYFGSRLNNKILKKSLVLLTNLIFRPLIKIQWPGIVREESSFPADVTHLCKKWAEHFDIIAHRDQHYLNWRISNPLMKHRLLCAYCGSQIVAYLVYNISNSDYIDIMDFIWDDDRAALSLLFKVEKIGRKKNIKVIRFRISVGRKIVRLFRRAGYFKSRTKFPMIGRCVSCDKAFLNLLKKKSRSVYWSYFDRNE